MVKTSLKKSASPGRKFAQVRDGAWRIFARDGFAGASVDDIAASAGVSKATLYAYFPDKRLMFEDVVRAEMDRLRDSALASVPRDLPAAQTIPLMTLAISTWLLTERRVQLMRLIVSEAVRFPSLATSYYEQFSRPLADELCARLDELVSRKELDIDDSGTAAEHLIHLSCTHALEKTILRLGKPAPDLVALEAEGAAQMFLRAYGTDDRDGSSQHDYRSPHGTGPAAVA